MFTRTKHGANRLTKQLQQDGIEAAAIHGNKSQSARTQALADFKNYDVRALVATEVAARGLDIKELPHVVNYELPNVPEDYVHRIGRTGRAGATGIAVSLVAPDEIGPAEGHREGAAQADSAAAAAAFRASRAAARIASRRPRGTHNRSRTQPQAAAAPGKRAAAGKRHRKRRSNPARSRAIVVAAWQSRSRPQAAAARSSAGSKAARAVSTSAGERRDPFAALTVSARHVRAGVLRRCIAM